MSPMNYLQRMAAVSLLAILVAGGPAAHAGVPQGNGSYDDLVALTSEFFAWRSDAAGTAVDRPAEQVKQRIDELRGFQVRLEDMAVADWDRPRQAEYLAVRSAMDQHDFLLHVSRPWSRDPGYYVDRMLRLTFTDLPVVGEPLNKLQSALGETVELANAARRNLANVPADFADLAIHNLTHADGVGHGHPYRTVPPAGVIGWYDDLLSRARKDQPALVPDIEAAREAVTGFLSWLEDNRSSMTADAGVGEELLDWYLMHVKYMPYSSNDIVAMGQRELERTWAFYALEQHRNRDLPVLELPTSQEEYEARIASVDADIRTFIDEQNFMTLPDHIPDDWREVGFNVPWIERDGGPNYWEQIQYRDPSPDHWHAVIPGHRIDGRTVAKITHPVRQYFRDGGRMEGWALYLEETPLQLGFYEERPRTRELIYNFAIFRAARTLGDVFLQRNEISTDQAVTFWREKTPWLDGNVARVDAEIYLRRPPGYGLGYTVGSFQMFKLLADRKRQLGDDFDLGEFHDTVMASGALPIALIRYEITGLDDEVSRFWNRTPLSELLAQ